MNLRLPARSAVWENRATVPAMLLVSMVSIQLGTALATTLFAAAGVLGVVLMRNAFSALALTVVSRPALRGRPLSHWLWAAALGVVTMAMNLAFYASTARIPLGVAVAVDFLGPITVAVIGIRRPIQLVWPVLAYTGIALLTPLADITSLDPVGLLLALTAACGWGAYILMTARTGALFGDSAGLTLATTFGALAVAPLVILHPPQGLFEPSVLLLGLVVALLSTAVPFSLEYAVLRHASPSTVGVLLSAEPAMAALLGLLVLGQRLDPVGWLAVALVSCAGAGVVLFMHQPPDRSGPAVRPAESIPDERS